MKNLLVAIDFSPASKAAFEFAAGLSLTLNARLTAIHVAAPVIALETVDQSLVKKMEQQENQQLLDHLQRFTTIYPEMGQEKLTAAPRAKCFVKRGDASMEIIKMANQNEIDLILIGSKAKHTIWQQVFGSLTTELISDSPVSILIIPEKNKVESIRNIAFATATKLKEKAIMPNLYQLARRLNAEVHPFYINPRKKERFKLKEESLDVSWNLPEPPPSVTMIREKSVIEGITYFLEKYPAEILALFVPKRAYFEQIFHRSLSKRIAYSTRVPLLICKS